MSDEERNILIHALQRSNELMEKLINGDKFHIEYLLAVQTLADKALKKVRGE